MRRAVAVLAALAALPTSAEATDDVDVAPGDSGTSGPVVPTEQALIPHPDAKGEEGRAVPAIGRRQQPRPPAPACEANRFGGLQVSRARLRGGRLDLRAAMARDARGSATIRIRSGGRTTTSEVLIRGGAIALTRRLSRRTATIEVVFPGDGRYAADAVSLRAAPDGTPLGRTRAALVGDRLEAGGTARGVRRGTIRVRLRFHDVACRVQEVTGRATIVRGRWSFATAVPPEARAGEVTVRVAGSFRARRAGIQRSLEVAR